MRRLKGTTKRQSQSKPIVTIVPLCVLGNICGFDSCLSLTIARERLEKDSVRIDPAIVIDMWVQLQDAVLSVSDGVDFS